MKDGGNDEKRQDNSKVENMERVSIDGLMADWQLNGSECNPSLPPLPTLQNCYKLFINSRIMKKIWGLCVDMEKIKLQVNAPSAEEVPSKNSLLVPNHYDKVSGW